MYFRHAFFAKLGTLLALDLNLANFLPCSFVLRLVQKGTPFIPQTSFAISIYCFFVVIELWKQNFPNLTRILKLEAAMAVKSKSWKAVMVVKLILALLVKMHLILAVALTKKENEENFHVIHLEAISMAKTL